MFCLGCVCVVFVCCVCVFGGVLGVFCRCGGVVVVVVVVVVLTFIITWITA